MSRSARLGGALLVVFAILFEGCGGASPGTSSASSGASDKGVQLTWVDGGGAYHDCVVKAWLDPYSQQTGVVFNYVGQTDNAQVKAQVEAKNVTYSVYNGDNTWGLKADSAYLDPLDYSIIASKADMLPGFASDYRIANMVYSMALAYNTNKVGGNVPQGWADFFDLQKFPGKRAVFDYSAGGIFEAALMADGVSPDKLYPLDIPRAIKKLNSIKNSMVFWGQGAQSEDLIGSGEVTMAMMYNARATDAKNMLHKPVEIQWNQQLLTAAYLTVPKGTAHKDAAMRLVNYITSAQNNGKLSQCFGVSPTNTKSAPDPTMGPNLPTAHVNLSYAKSDDQWISDNSKMLETQYQNWKTS